MEITAKLDGVYAGNKKILAVGSNSGLTIMQNISNRKVNEDWPIIGKFRALNTTYCFAIDKKNVAHIRRAEISIKELASLTKIIFKEYQKLKLAC